MPTDTLARVPANTASDVNAAVTRKTLQRLTRCATSNALAAERLDQLPREWDIERALAAGAASLVVTGLTLGMTVDRRWLWLPAIVGAFLLQHAVQGWCPPLPVLRRLGFRTPAEISREQYALKAMRGDFAGLGMDRGQGCAVRAFRAARPV